jgi:tRNA/tmRNA/rRNA uracil-C5-methylase (TrmA/RlmC/RlmD family)
MSPQERSTLRVGERINVTIEKIAHGGHCIARHEGAVIFVRHAIPGENCTVEITSVGASFNRADVVEVHSTSSDRVNAPCSFAHPNGCGGCDFQHISESRQRELKAEVIKEQFSRIAKMDIEIDVEEVGPSLGWRTRCIAHVSAQGKIGFYQSRSHTVEEISDCPILAPQLRFEELAKSQFLPQATLEIATSNTGERTVALNEKDGRQEVIQGSEILHHKVASKNLDAHYQSFWQSHISAPEVLTKCVLECAEAQSGDQILDLYGGVGLFTSVLIDRIGSSGSITLVEGSKRATADGIRNFADYSNIKVVTGDVSKILPRIASADVIILDPPREGADKSALTEMIRMRPRRIVYVSCDPASLARDARILHDAGFPLAKLRAFDLFPMTHHIECVALFTSDKVS